MSDRVYTQENYIEKVEFEDAYIVLYLTDERIVHLPLKWYPRLQNATPEQRANFTNYGASVFWADLDDGFSVETVLLGRPKK